MSCVYKWNVFLIVPFLMTQTFKNKSPSSLEKKRNLPAQYWVKFVMLPT